MPRRRQHSGEFKAKVVVQALKGQKTINELAQVHALHPLLITQWKKQALEALPQVFADRRARAMREAEEEKARLYEEIGRMRMEMEWLKKKLDRVE